MASMDMAALLACSCGIYYVIVYEIWLPRDKEMIAQFQAHRAEFEEAVRRYRAFEKLKYSSEKNEDAYIWFKQADTETLMKNAGIEAHDIQLGGGRMRDAPNRHTRISFPLSGTLIFICRLCH